MGKYLFILTIILCQKIYSQSETFPLNFDHNVNGLFNIRVGQAMDITYKIGTNSEYSYSFESTSLSLAIMQNLGDHSEMLVSLNPILWVLTVIGNGLEPNRSERITYISAPFQVFMFVLQEIPNAKIEPHLSDKARISIGWNTDYFLSKKGFCASFCSKIGPKYNFSNIEVGLYLNYQALGSESMGYDKFSLRFDLAYVFNKNSVSEFITYCRSVSE